MDTAAVVSNILKGQNILTLLRFLNLTTFMWPQSAVVHDDSIFDFLIIGGGTAGCVIASRLAKLNFNVLLIEAGGQPPLETELAGLFPYSKESQMDWNFTSVYDSDAYKYHQRNVVKVQQGKVLGGSGQVNYMLYGKGIPKDYDKWAEITNDTSWQFRNLCTIFKKVEKLVDKRVLNSPDVKFHGTKGKISINKRYDTVNEDFFESYRELGQKTVLDINPNNTLGYTNAYYNIYQRSRQSTAYSYLSPEKDNPKLSVIYNALATEIIFDENKKAIGVKILTENGTIITVKAKKEIIVSAGVIKTPQLLMLSGIGPAAHLRKNNIDVISDLPVGQNFQDHPCIIMIYKLGEAKPAFPNPYIFPVAVMDGYVALKEDQSRPDYQILSGVVNFPEFFAQACAFVFTFNYSICDFIAKAVRGKRLHFVTHSLLYPKSCGKVLLENKDPKQNPIIMPNYYSNEEDLDNHAKYADHYNQVLKTKFFKRIGAELVYPNLDTCVGLEKSTMEYWKCYVKGMSSTLHMYFGTCAMGSVVNSELQVIGVKNLRVADASVIPSSVGSTIQATTIMIAEKLVELLTKTHKQSRK